MNIQDAAAGEELLSKYFFTKEVSVQYSGTNGASAPVVKLTRLLTLHDTQSGPQIAGFSNAGTRPSATTREKKQNRLHF
jgi:hypothetical protein